MAADSEPKIEKHFDIAAMCAFWDKQNWHYLLILEFMAALLFTGQYGGI